MKESALGTGLPVGSGIVLANLNDKIRPIAYLTVFSVTHLVKCSGYRL